MSGLALNEASAIIEQALAEGRKHGARPLTVAVLDAGGHLKAFASEDQSSLLRPEIAIGKAYGALIFGTGTRLLSQLSEHRPHFFQSINTLAGGKAVPMPGGLTIRKERQVVGAVGVSGDTPEQDEAFALAGVESAGLKGDTGPRE